MGSFHWSVLMGSAFICRTWGLTSHSVNGTNRAFPTEASFSCYSVQQLKTDSVDKMTYLFHDGRKVENLS